jgi:hypothetical protein
MPSNRLITLAIAGMTVLGGCVGSVGSGDQGSPNDPKNPPGNPGVPGGGGSTGGNPAGPPPAAEPGDPGPQVFRRLTRLEYNNTVRDLLGDSSAQGNTFPPDTESSHSGFTRGGLVGNADANRIFEASEKVATEAVAKRLGDLLPCKTAPAAEADQNKCAADFIERFGRRAFRRPLAQDESTAFLALYNNQRTEVKNDFPGAVRVLLTAFLMSPNFLYRWETVPQGVVKEGNFLKFSSNEMASRLSYLFWTSMPDDQLFAAADANELSTPGQIEAQVRRLLKDPKAKDALGDFAHQWLELTDLREARKSPAFTNYNPAVAEAMLAETREFISNHIVNGDAKLPGLFTAKSSFIDAGLAKVYGVAGVTSTALIETPLNPAQRAGILTQGAFNAAHAKADETHPIGRGKTLADRVLCKNLPPPPDDIPEPKPASSGLTTRERFEEHGQNACAKSCHEIIDPLGFAFENYDAVGGWRVQDAGKPVNAASKLTIDGMERTFNNAVELTAMLASSKEVGDCMTRMFVRYALRRKETTGDEATIAQIQDSFQKSNYDVRELLVTLTKSKAFTHRVASTGELLP